MAQHIVKVTLVVKGDDKNRALEFTRQRFNTWFQESNYRTKLEGDLLWYGFGDYSEEEIGAEYMNTEGR